MRVYVDPSSVTRNVDETVTLFFKIEADSSVYGFQVHVQFNPDTLTCENVANGDFITAGNGGFVLPAIIRDNYFVTGATFLGSLPGRTGSGTLCSATFKVKKAGVSPIHFDPVNTFLVDSEVDLLPVTLEDGVITTFGSGAAAAVTRLVVEDNLLGVEYDVLLGETAFITAGVNQIAFKTGQIVVENTGTAPLRLYGTLEWTTPQGVPLFHQWLSETPGTVLPLDVDVYADMPQTESQDFTLTAGYLLDGLTEVPTDVKQFTVSLGKKLTISVNDSNLGTTSPPPGLYLVAANSPSTVYALPSLGCEVDSWIVDGVSKPASASIMVQTDRDHTVEAVFKVGPDLQYTLNIVTFPVMTVASGFTVDGGNVAVPYSHLLSEGVHSLFAPAQVSSGRNVFDFDYWTNGSTTGQTQTQSINLQSNITWTAHYIPHIVPKASLTGKVTNAVTDAPIPNATVSLGAGLSDVTDALGDYLIPNVPPSNTPYPLTVVAAGFDSYSSAQNMPDAVPYTRDISLQPSVTPTATLWGKVTDADTSDPIEGANVSLGGSLSDVTDAFGDYEILNVPTLSTAYTLTVTKNGYQTSTTQITLSNPQRYQRDVVLISSGAQTVTLQGKVTSNTYHAPIAGATVSLGGGLSDITDVNGDYLISSIPPGTYDIIVVAVGYLTLHDNDVALPEAQTYTRNYSLDPSGGDTATVRGVVRGYFGLKTVGGATVTLAGDAEEAVTTDGAGQFEFLNVPLGSYGLTVTHKWHEPYGEELAITAAETIDLTINLMFKRVLLGIGAGAGVGVATVVLLKAAGKPKVKRLGKEAKK